MINHIVLFRLVFSCVCMCHFNKLKILLSFRLCFLSRWNLCATSETQFQSEIELLFYWMNKRWEIEAYDCGSYENILRIPWNCINQSDRFQFQNHRNHNTRFRWKLCIFKQTTRLCWFVIHFILPFCGLSPLKINTQIVYSSYSKICYRFFSMSRGNREVEARR